MKSFAISGLALATLALVAPIQANHGCNGVITDIDVGPEKIYLDDRSTLGTPLDRWLYLESNGVKGLQSGGKIEIFEDPEFPSLVDPCFHHESDMWLV